jgi:very-short-patch-repair endonuclease
MTVPQKKMLEALTEGWEPEVAIRTMVRRLNPEGYPVVYKVDLAHREMKIAVEIDGKSHGLRSRQEQDAKKGRCLLGLGWKVLRFQNERILNDLESVLKEIEFAYTT